MITELEINGMTCDNCVRHVRQALEGVSGVDKAEISLEDRYAVVHHDPRATTDELIEAVTEEGYEARFKDQRS